MALVNWPVTAAFGQSLSELCEERGIRLELHDVLSRYRERYTAATNVITWGVKFAHAWYVKDGKNVLFVENGLLCQSSGIYVDHQGFFAHSSICQEKAPASLIEIVRLRQHIWCRFRWRLLEGSDPNGPILIVMQNHRDAPCLHYFPLNKRRNDSMLRFLELCAAYLPDRKAIVRPHPRFLAEFYAGRPEYERTFRKNWEVSVTGSVYDVLKTCSAMVTTNSTTATEAVALGIPVGVFGHSVFTGSGVVLDAASEPVRMKGLLAFKPDVNDVERYLCAVMRHQLMFGATKSDVAANESVGAWLNRCMV